MRSAVVLAAFATGALAIPYGHRHHKRDIVTDYNIVVTTAVVYVTAGEPAPTAAAPSIADVTTTAVPVPATTSITASVHDKVASSSKHHHTTSSSPAPAAPSVVVITTVVDPPIPSSTYIPPPAPTTSVEASPEVQSAPAPSSTSAPAPQSSAPAPQSPAPEPSNTGSSDPVATTYQEIVVLHHNLHRRNHSAPDIEWSDNLATSAAMVAATCNYNHNMGMLGGGYGQNIAAGVDSQNVSAVITDMFYNGEVNHYDGLYGQAQPSMTDFDSWGHFSQIVWKASTQVGCATQYCPNGLANTGSLVEPYFTVCNYGPEGNMANGYGANIGQPLGMPTAQWNTGL